MAQEIYDLDYLQSSVDCVDLASRIGMKLSPSGQFCQCPNGHHETQLNHCAIYHDHAHCFSCGFHGGPLTILQTYYKNVLYQDIGFKDACRMLGDMYGGAERFLTEGEAKTSRVITLPITDEEIKLIGIDKQDLLITWISSQFAAKSKIRNAAAIYMNKLEAIGKSLHNTSFTQYFYPHLEARYKCMEKIYEKVKM